MRQIMPTLVLAALAAAGRILFGPIPDFKPVSAIAIIAGATLGRRNGFMVGALAALTSNFFFGQGMWTPWQMYAWGLVGYVGGALAHAGAFDRADGTVRMPALLAYGFASGCCTAL
ncbi:MAG: ECF transporter S component [Collinsella sp.]